jgi:hypothetical protein
MTIAALIAYLISQAEFGRVMNNPLAQFGPPTRQYLGATLLPERPVPQNEYTEEAIKYKTIVANHGTRYNPVQLKGGSKVGSMKVTLGNSDTGDEFTGRDYDALIRLLESMGNPAYPTQESIAAALGWADFALLRPLLERNEVDRWQAIVRAQVSIVGDNGYKDIIQYADPTGHRVNVVGDWDDPDYDILGDILAQNDLVTSKGYVPNRQITGRAVLTKMMKNNKLRARAGNVTILNGNVTAVESGRVSRAGLDAIMQEEQLPPIEMYNLTYDDNTGTKYFLDRDAYVIACQTGRNEEVRLQNDQSLVVPDVIGYTGIGRAAGQTTSGRASFIQSHEDKPPRMDGQSWQTSLPVITDPEAFAVLRNL